MEGLPIKSQTEGITFHAGLLLCSEHILFIYLFIYLSIPLKLQSSPPCPPSERLWLQFSGFPASNTVQYIWLVLFEYMWQPLIVILYRRFASHSITGLHRLLATCHVAHSCLSTATTSRLQCCLRFAFVHSFWTQATLTQATKAVAPLLCTRAASDIYIGFWKRLKERAGGTWCGGREYGLAIVFWSWWANANAKANACVEARIAAFKANSFEWFAITKIVRNNCERISHPASFIPHDILCIKLCSVRVIIIFFSWTWFGPGHSHL